MRVDFATIVGFLSGCGLLFLAVHLGGGIGLFLDLNSFLIVAGGTLGATLVSYSLTDFFRAYFALRTAFFPDDSSTVSRVQRVLDAARKVRASDNKAALNLLDEESDPFFADCLELLGDGLEGPEIRKVMDLEIDFLEDRHRKAAQLFESMGALAPAMGLLGTLIGLVQMLKTLDDPSKIGPAMALALLTTFYGAAFANLIFLPLAAKLRTRSEEEVLVKELTVEGVASIAEGVNPQRIERRLMSFLPRDSRHSEYQ